MAPSRRILYDLSRHIVCNTLRNHNGKPCPDPVRTVAEYTAQYPVLVRAPGEGIRLVGEKLGRCFSTTSDPGMKLISSLNTALHEFHESGICLSCFDESNLVVSDEGPKQQLLFRPTECSDDTEPPQDLTPGVVVNPGVMVMPDTGRLKFKDVEFYESTPAGIQANFHDAHAFITKNLLQPEIPVPDCIKHLLKLMKSPESATMGPLIARHASVVCFALRMLVVMRYIQYVRHALPYQDRAAAATVLEEMPYLDDWIERAKKNKLLELIFNHRRDKYLRDNATGFLDFYYDVSINGMEWCWSRWFKPDGGYTLDEAETVAVVTYPELMPKIQESLWKTGHLKKAHWF
ncbi:hypothetical protein ACP70R_012738 [Stipagrostis hirtigluma subsp. patula]